MLRWIQNICCSELIVHVWLSTLKYNVPVLIIHPLLFLLRVAYNDRCLQTLLHEPRWCSASWLFVLHNVLSFTAIIRQPIVCSLLCSLRDCNNLLVCAMLHNDIYLQSSLWGGVVATCILVSLFLLLFLIMYMVYDPVIQINWNWNYITQLSDEDGPVRVSNLLGGPRSLPHWAATVQ